MRDRYYRYHRRNSAAMGVVAIAVGILFLFYQSGFFPPGFYLDIWAVVLFAIGLGQFIGACDGRGRIWALGFLTAGTIVELNALGYTHIHMKQVWPLFLIFAGISALWHTMKGPRSGSRVRIGVYKVGRETEGDEGNGPESPNGPEDPQIDMDFVLGGGEPRVESKNFRGGRINAVLGGFKLDLTHADIEGTEAVLYVNAVMGGGEIVVPETWLVDMHGSAFLGGYDNKTRYFQPDATKPVKRLVIRGNAMLGGIEIKN